MVLPPEKMSEEIRAKAAAEQVRKIMSEGKNAEQLQRLVIRQWCIERAVQVCGGDGVIWIEKKDAIPDVGPLFKSAVVPIAREIYAFITGETEYGGV